MEEVMVAKAVLRSRRELGTSSVSGILTNRRKLGDVHDKDHGFGERSSPRGVDLDICVVSFVPIRFLGVLFLVLVLVVTSHGSRPDIHLAYWRTGFFRRPAQD
jgi:hypothetical protein